MQAPAFFVPEPRAKGFARPLERFAPASIQLRPDAQRVDPQRLDLDRLADAWGHDPVPHLGVHPGELDAGRAGGEQAVGVHPNAVARALGVTVENLEDGALQASRRRATEAAAE